MTATESEKKASTKKAASRTKSRTTRSKDELVEELVELPATLVQDVKSFVGLVRQQVSVGSGLWKQADELATRLELR